MSKALVIKGADFSENSVAIVKENLPYDARVAYLQGDGNAYINTGVNVSSDIKFIADINITNGGKQINVLGGRVDTYNSNLIAYYGYGSTTADQKWNWRYGETIVAERHNNVTGNFVLSNKENSNILVVSGAQNTSVTAPVETFTSNIPIFLFAWNANNGNAPSTSNNVDLKIKSVKFYNGSTLIRDFIPVRVGQVGYLYDKVSKELFGNVAETGAFVIGSDV